MRRGITPIISILLLVLITVVSAGSAFYWLTEVQTTSQNEVEAYQTVTLERIITEGSVASTPKYSISEEDDPLNLSDVSFDIFNDGQVPIPLTGGDINMICRSDNEVLCETDLSGTCRITTEKMYASLIFSGTGGGSGEYGGVYYTVDGVNWFGAVPGEILGDPTQSFFSLENYIPFAEEADLMYFGSDDGGAAYPTIAWTSDGDNWSPDTIPSAAQVLALDSHLEKLYAGTTTGSAGQIWWSVLGLDWISSHNATETTVESLHSFGNYIFAGTGNGTGGADEGKIYRNDGGGDPWTADTVSAATNSINSFEEFNGELYAATGDLLFYTTVGCGGCVTTIGNRGYVLKLNGDTWTPSLDPSALGLPLNSTIYAIKEYQNQLYAGVWNGSETQVWITDDGSTWTNTNSNVSGSPFSKNIYAMEVLNNQLYASISLPSGVGGYYDAGEVLRYNLVTNTWISTAPIDNTWGPAVEMYTRTECTNRDVNCTEGCTSNLAPSDLRHIKLTFENTLCDIGNVGLDSEYLCTLTAGRDFQITFPIKKEAK